MNKLLLPLLIITLSGCHYVDSSVHYSHHSGYIFEFYYDNFDHNHPLEVDPYYNDGIFEVFWDFRNIDSDLSLAITVSSIENPHHEVTLLSEDIITHSTVDYSGKASFYYDVSGILWQINASNNFRYVSDIAHMFDYGENLNLTIYACEIDGDCYESTQPIRFW